MDFVVKKQISLSLLKSQVGGRTIGYLSGGEGPPLLFIHGWAVTPFVYKSALDMAARTGNRVIAPFLPGFGPSESFGGRWPSSSEVSEWIETFLERSGEERPAVVVGHSLGGGIAASYAADFPGSIERLFLMSSVGGHVTPQEGLAQTRSALGWSLSLPIDLLASEVTYGNMVTMIGTGMIQLIRDPIGLWRLSRVARSYPLFSELEKIVESEAKVFVVGAEGDRIITRDAIARLAKYASVDPIWVPGTHSWISAHPEKFVEVLASSC